MIVAEKLRRKMKMTMTTRHMVSISVNLTSATDSRIGWERSLRDANLIDAGICACSCGISSLTRSTSSTTFEPGCR